MDQDSTTLTFTDDDRVIAYKLGALSAEVRVLKWSAALGFAIIFAFLTFLAQQVGAVQANQVEIIERLTRVENRLDAVESRLDAVEDRLDAVELLLVDFSKRIASNEQQIASHSHL